MATTALETEQREISSPEETVTEKPPISRLPFVVFVFEDGQGTVRENTTVADWQDSDLVNKIREEIGSLRGRNSTITAQLFEPLPKAKHGRIVPRQRRRGIKIGLKQEREANVSRIDHKERLIDEIESLLIEKAPQSNPLDPLEFRVTNVVVIEGEPLSPEDQEWWQFVRQQAPEVWDLLQEDEEMTDYEYLHTYFQRRQAMRDSRRDFSGNRESADTNFEMILNMLSSLPDGEYAKIKPIIERIRDYFTGEL